MQPARSKLVLEAIHPCLLKPGYFTLMFQIAYDPSNSADMALEPNVPSGTLTQVVAASQVSQYVLGQSYYCDLTAAVAPTIK